MLRIATLCALSLTLSACGSSDESYSGAPNNDFGFTEAMADEESEASGRVASVDLEEPAAETGEIPVSQPQIAYRYGFGFRVDTDHMAGLQQTHADLCEARGNQLCRIISMEQSGAEGDYGYGHLRLAVSAGIAREFGAELTGAAGEAGGEQISSSITGEDLSKRLIDTEARVRARTLLRDRLMEILRSRRGTVAELVEAERGVAQVNEEIDQATSWLAEMRGRVSFSDVSIEYRSSSLGGGGFLEPISKAFDSIGVTFGTVIAVLIYLLTGLIPIAITIGLIVWGWRKSGLRLFGRRKKVAKTEE